MKNKKLWMLAAILICGAGVVLTACKGKKQAEDETSDEAAEYKKIIRPVTGRQVHQWYFRRQENR